MRRSTSIARILSLVGSWYFALASRLLQVVPLDDLPIEALPHAVRVHPAHGNHLPLVGKAEDAGGQPLLADFRTQLLGAHEVVARQGEAGKAQPAAEDIEDQPAQGE